MSNPDTEWRGREMHRVYRHGLGAGHAWEALEHREREAWRDVAEWVADEVDAAYERGCGKGYGEGYEEAAQTHRASEDEDDGD